MSFKRDEFNPDQPREPNGQFGSGGAGAAKKEALSGKGGASAPAMSPHLEKAHAKHAAAVEEYGAAKTALAAALKSGDPTAIAAAQATHKYAMNKTSSAKHVIKKLSGLHEAKAPEAKAPEPKPAPPPPAKAPEPPPPPAPEPVHPKVAKVMSKYEQAKQEYEQAKVALAEAKKGGNLEEIAKAQAHHKYTMNKTSSAKHVIKKMSGQASDITVVKESPKAAAPKPAAPPVEAKPSMLGSYKSLTTVKVAGKNEAGGPLVGVVVGQNPAGTHSLVLQLGKGEPEWQANATLSTHLANSTWAKNQEKIAQEAIQSGKHETALIMPVKAQPASKPTPQVKSKEPVHVSPAQAGNALAMKAPSAWGKAHYSEWAKSLTTKETSAIVSYSNSGYGPTNAALRKGTVEGNSHVKEHVAQLDSALAKAPRLPHDVMLSRGMDGDLSHLKEGMKYEDKGFMSTSVGDKAAFDHKDNILRINAPKGTHGAYLLQSSHSHEKEYLLARGSQVRVTKVEMKGSKRYIHGDLIVTDAGNKDAAEQKLTEEEMQRLIEEEPETGDLSRNPRFNGHADDLIVTE